jgi:hypothetical protein
MGAANKMELVPNEAKSNYCRFGGEKRELSLVVRKTGKFLIINPLKCS